MEHSPAAHINHPPAMQIIGNATTELLGIATVSWLVPQVARDLFVVGFVLS